MITVDIAYSIITAESAEKGDYAESGMHATETLTFRELVRMLRDYSKCSAYPCTGDVSEWVTSDVSMYSPYFRGHMERGETREHSMHYSHTNPTRNAKYWRAALRASGFIKGQA